MKQNIEIVTVKISTMQNAFVIKTPKGHILIDTALPDSYGPFKDKLVRAGIDMGDIRYLFLTHNHEDHVGLLKEIMSEIPGLTLICHPKLIEILKNPVPLKKQGLVSPGFWSALLMRKMFNAASEQPQCLLPQKIGNIITVSREEKNLFKDLDLDASVIPTPGHTEDSLTLLLDTGSNAKAAFTGDLCWTVLTKPFPAIIQNLKEWKTSIRLLLDSGAKHFYCAHKGILSSRVLEKALNKTVKLYPILETGDQPLRKPV